MKSQFLEPNLARCKTCIFRSPQEGGTVLHPARMEEITEYLCQGNQHICHTNPDRACRGGRDLQLQVFAALGLIDEPTDEALRLANQAFLQGQKDSRRPSHDRPIKP